MADHTAPDETLVEEARSGNQAAFRTLYYRHVDNVFGLVTRVLGPAWSEREDVVQEVFLQAHRALPRFRGESSFATFLHRIGVHVAVASLRRRCSDPQASGRQPDDDLAAPGSSEGRLEARAEVRRMYGMLDRMSPGNRAVFVLYEFEGLPLDRVARELGLPLFTVASRLRRARAALMEGLELRTGAGASEQTKEGT
jgi:RNA polymerase sigma-70 factor (ECF subfamily)